MLDCDSDKDAINRAKHGLPLAWGVTFLNVKLVEEEDARFDYDETALSQPAQFRSCMTEFALSCIHGVERFGD